MAKDIMFDDEFQFLNGAIGVGREWAVNFLS